MVKKHKKDDFAGMVFVGCVILGIGTGMLFSRPDIGVLIGLGIGFILMAVIKSKNK